MSRYLAILALLLCALSCTRLTALSVESAASEEPARTLSNIRGIDHRGAEFSLESALESGPVVVIFYRGHW